MPERLVWTPEQDEKIRSMRLAGATWDQIAASFGLSRFTIIDRGRRINAVKAVPEIALVGADRDDEDPDRDPYPPGHEVTWGAITAGTLIEGLHYPVG